MKIVSVEELQTRLAELLEQAERGETVLIMRGNVRLGQLGPALQRPLPAEYRLGLLEGQETIPANWKDLGRAEIEEQFYGE